MDVVDVSTEWILNISVILNATARDSMSAVLSLSRGRRRPRTVDPRMCDSTISLVLHATDKGRGLYLGKVSLNTEGTSV